MPISLAAEVILIVHEKCNSEKAQQFAVLVNASNVASVLLIHNLDAITTSNEYLNIICKESFLCFALLQEYSLSKKEDCTAWLPL